MARIDPAEIRKARPSRLKVLILQSPATALQCSLYDERCMQSLLKWDSIIISQLSLHSTIYEGAAQCQFAMISECQGALEVVVVVCGYICNNICLHNSTAMTMIMMIRLSRIKYSQPLRRMLWSNSEALCSALTRSTSQSSCFISLIATI